MRVVESNRALGLASDRFLAEQRVLRATAKLGTEAALHPASTWRVPGMPDRLDKEWARQQSDHRKAHRAVAERAATRVAKARSEAER